MGNFRRIFLLAILTAAWYWNKQKQIKLIAGKSVRIGTKPPVSVQEILSPVSLYLHAESNLYYRELHHSIWKYLNNKLQISGSEMNKSMLAFELRKAGVEALLISEMVAILQQCETGIYTPANIIVDKKAF